HLIGISAGANIQIFNGGDGSQVGGNGHDFTVGTIDYTANSVTLTAALPIALSAKRNDFVQIKPVSAAVQTLKFSAKAKGAWGNDLQVRVRPMVGVVFNILFDPVLGPAAPASTAVAAPVVVTAGPVMSAVEVLSAAGFAAADRVTIGGTEYNVDSVDITDAAHPKLKIKDSDLHTVSVGTKVTQLRKANDPTTAAKSVNVWGASALYN